MSELVEEIRTSDKLALLLSMLPATIITAVEVSVGIIIPTTFSDDWFSLLGYFVHTIRHSD